MNSTLRRHIMDRRMRDRNRRGGYDGNYDYGRGEYEGEFHGNYESDYARTMPGGGYRRDYADEEYEMDGRRGVKYTGPYGIGGRRHYPRRDRAMYDDEYDYADDDKLKLTKSEMRDWKENLENEDGTVGAHFDMNQIMQAIQSLGIQMKGFTEKDICMAANMLYSDYCTLNHQFVSKDKEAMYYVKFAYLFLTDKDSKFKGAEKLAVYYDDFVNDEE